MNRDAQELPAEGAPVQWEPGTVEYAQGMFASADVDAVSYHAGVLYVRVRMDGRAFMLDRTMVIRIGE